jgi:hypothetical protein
MRALACELSLGRTESYRFGGHVENEIDLFRWLGGL